MSDDIVKRLEQIETDIEYSDVAHVCGKAAEIIERLRAELAAAEGELEYHRRNAEVSDLIASRLIVALRRYADGEDGELACAALAFVEETFNRGAGQ